MKIKQFIVTYNNKFQINSCLDSIFDNLSKEELNMLDIFVINNHSSFELSSRFAEKVNVLHNSLRPDFSTGHLARNWNQALLNGFKNLNNPDADIIITNQDDTRFVKNYISMIIDIHKSVDIAQFGWGDNFTSYTPTAVKYIGMWDERFCGIGYQEADYFLRALLYHRNKSSIQDGSHGRNLNVLSVCPIEIIPSGNARNELYHRESLKYHEYNRNLYIKKWGFPPGKWTDETKEALPQIDSYILYPYFEKDIITLNAQRFFI